MCYIQIMTSDTGQTADSSPDPQPETGSLFRGKLLIAMPHLEDPDFERAVVLLCAHSDEGAMGFIINKAIDRLTLEEMLEELKLDDDATAMKDLRLSHTDNRVLNGGPCHPGNGFVVHSRSDEDNASAQENSHTVDPVTGFSSSLDFLRRIARGKGPERYFVTLGFAGWGPQQLEEEIRQNSWLLVDNDDQILFDADLDSKWDRAIARLGITADQLSAVSGEA